MRMATIQWLLNALRDGSPKGSALLPGRPFEEILYDTSAREV